MTAAEAAGSREGRRRVLYMSAGLFAIPATSQGEGERLILSGGYS